MVEDTLVGCSGLVIAACHSGTAAHLFFEFHDGLEEVGVEAETSVERVQELKLLGRIVAVIPHGATDDGIVFLFDKAVVVLAIGTASGEGNLLLLAVAQEVVVDKL